jgi:hypothetical protein
MTICRENTIITTFLHLMKTGIVKTEVKIICGDDIQQMTHMNQGNDHVQNDIIYRTEQNGA